MRPRLALKLACLAMPALLGCRMDDDGLKGKIAAPPRSEPEPGESAEPSTPNEPKPRTETPPPAMPDAGPIPGTVGEDAGARPDTDAGAPSGPDATPGPSSAIPPECDRLAPGPLAFSYRRDTPDSDDFTFDNDGYFLARAGRDIARLAYGGPTEMVVKNVVSERNTIDSLRVLAGGDIVIADYMGDMLVRIEPRGQRRRLASIEKPNKLAHGPGGFLYVVAIEGEIFRVHPDSGDTRMIGRVEGRLRGLTFSPDYKVMYVSDPRNDVLYSLQMRADGTADPPRVWARNVGDGPDGLATDACGNVYVSDHSGGPLRRVSPNGTVKVLAQLDRGPTSSVNFGSGKQGWDSRTLYTVSVDGGGTYEIKVGVPAAPPPPP
jgi:sugar lactone lactonase YvrE